MSNRFSNIFEGISTVADAIRTIRQDGMTDTVKKLDGFFSETTGAGISGYDKFTSYGYEKRAVITEPVLEALYTDNYIAAVIVDRIVNDALRSGYKVKWKDGDPELQKDVVTWAENSYNLTPVVARARKYSRLYGGGAIFLGADDREFDQEMAPNAPIKFIRPLSSRDLKPDPEGWNVDLIDQEFGTVGEYILTLPYRGLSGSDGPVYVDSSRLIPFYGIITTDRRFYQTGWGLSVLSRCYDAILRYEAGFDAVQHSLLESSVGIYKVEGFLQALAARNVEFLRGRMQLINTAKSVFRSIVLDTNESYERVEAHLGDAASIVEKQMLQIAGAARMPVSIIFGMAPTGLINSTGETDLEVWDGQVGQEQALTIGPAIRNLYQVLLAQPDSPTGGKVPEDLEIIFPAIRNPSQKEETNRLVQTVGALSGATTSGIMKPEEAAIILVDDLGLKLDLDSRRAALEAINTSGEDLINRPDNINE